MKLGEQGWEALEAIFEVLASVLRSRKIQGRVLSRGITWSVVKLV